MMTPGDEKIRKALYRNYINQGWPPRAARAAALASHPMEGDAKPVSRRLRKKLLRGSARFARRARNAHPNDFIGTATDALRDYYELADRYGDDYYRRRFAEDLHNARSVGS